MSYLSKGLLIGSTEAYSGKSGTILGLARHLLQQGRAIAYSKPVGTCWTEHDPTTEADLQFVREMLTIPNEAIAPPVVTLTPSTIESHLVSATATDYLSQFKTQLATLTADLVLVEGPGTLWEGRLFQLSCLEMAQALEMPILLVARYHSPLVVDALLQAKKELGDYLLGVVINDIPPDTWTATQTIVKPFLERQGIKVLGLLPQNKLLRSVSVRELVRQLQAKVLCRADRLDLMVESLTIGAMNVNSALEYFRKGENKAVVTGGDRTDLQLAALETSTSCLILTGHLPPQPLIISRAEDLEIPILSVNLDTLKTVEIVDQTFGTVRLQETIKVDCLQQLLAEHFDWDYLQQQLFVPS